MTNRSMTTSQKTFLTVVILGAVGVQGYSRTRSLGHPASYTKIVHVAAPTGNQETDRASIVAAIEKAQPGDTVQFGRGMYLVGKLITVSTPRLTFLGHREGTTLRGCDPSRAETLEGELTRAMQAQDMRAAGAVVNSCGMFELTGGYTTIRNLVLEVTRLGLILGCCQSEGVIRPNDGGYRIEGNTFRNSANGIRPNLLSSEPTVIRGNRFVNVYHAVSAAARHLHVLDNDISAPEPERVPGTRHPGGAIGITSSRGPGDTVTPTDLCQHNTIAGNRIDGYPDGILILVAPGTSCRHNVIRGNNIIVRRVRFPALRTNPSVPVIGNESDPTIVGVPIALENVQGPTARPGTTGPQGILEDNLIEGNQVMGADGLGIIVYRASRNRIVNNTISRINRRDPFPGNTLGFSPARWRDANGSGIWISPGSNENEIVGNTFTEIAAHAIVLAGDRNRVETRDARDAVRDLGNNNRMSGPGRTPPR